MALPDNGKSAALTSQDARCFRALQDADAVSVGLEHLIQVDVLVRVIRYVAVGAVSTIIPSIGPTCQASMASSLPSQS
jgi:hypothetical protein